MDPHKCSQRRTYPHRADGRLCGTLMGTTLVASRVASSNALHAARSHTSSDLWIAGSRSNVLEPLSGGKQGRKVLVASAVHLSGRDDSVPPLRLRRWRHEGYSRLGATDLDGVRRPRCIEPGMCLRLRRTCRSGAWTFLTCRCGSLLGTRNRNRHSGSNADRRSLGRINRQAPSALIKEIAGNGHARSR